MFYNLISSEIKFFNNKLVGMYYFFLRDNNVFYY